MKNGKRERMINKVGNIIVSFALKVTEINANTACVYIAHQPKLPDAAKKLRKF